MLKIVFTQVIFNDPFYNHFLANYYFLNKTKDFFLKLIKIHFFFKKKRKILYSS
jgi:hypothetical protein